MPWSASDARRKTRKANTPAKQHQWSAIANKMLGEGRSEGSAIRIANAAVKKRKRK